MNNLTIENVDGKLLVDSRLVAERLEIQHKNFLETIRKYQSKIEQRFGVVAFKTEKPSKGTLGGRPEYFAYLTENQTTALMTFSRNTDAVIECKLDLVEAFSKAKELLIHQKQPLQHQQLWWDRMKLFNANTRIPVGYWCVFSELMPFVCDLEAGGFIFPEGKCVDISVGRCWNIYLDSIGKGEIFLRYYHHYPDKRGTQPAKVYPNKLLPLFREWLMRTYVFDKFPTYVKKNCTSQEQALVATIVQRYQLNAA